MKLRPFELVIFTIFAVLGLLSLFIISNYKPKTKPGVVSLGGAVEIWGTMPAEAVEAVLRPLGDNDPAWRAVSYSYKSPSQFNSEFLEALADNRAPDLVLIPHEELVHNRGRLLPLSYTNYPIRDFRNNFIDGAEVFVLKDGIYALPVAVDPLMMYWNRDMLSTRGILTPPATWEELVNSFLTETVERDFSHNITLSTLAFGEYNNVTNVFPVLSMLLIQGGSQLITERPGDGFFYNIELNQMVNGGGESPLQNALSFYVNFSNPSNEFYTWNRSLPNDKQQFLAEKLFLYFGMASEAKGLARQNPNLNFDIAEVPQGATATVRRTYGSFYGLAVVRSARNPNGAYQVMQALSASDNAAEIAITAGMAPVRRVSLEAGSNDQYGRLAFKSAPIARGWWSPNPQTIQGIFKQMIEDTTAGRRRIDESVRDALLRLRDNY